MYVDVARRRLRAFSAYSACKLDVLGHDGDALGVDGAQVRVLEQTNEVGLARLLQSHHCRALEAQVRLEVLCDLADETLEGQLADEQLSALLVATDLAQGDRAWPVAMRLLDAARRRGALACRLRRQLLPRRLAPGRFASSLLRSCHGISSFNERRVASTENRSVRMSKKNLPSPFYSQRPLVIG